MRLTLRTLLAYLDDTLEPTEIKQIGQKVSESDAAQELIARIKQITRRRRLTTPPVSGPGAANFDPNTVAEYLDNALSGEQIAEVEKLCLESDVHLAEIATCHQILTLVLGEPALVPPTARERMYGLVQGKESIPFRKAAIATTPASGANGAGADHDEMPLSFLLRRGGWPRWALPLAGILLLAGLILTLIRVMSVSPQHNRQVAAQANKKVETESPDTTTGAAKDNNKEEAQPPAAKPADSERVVTEKPADKQVVVADKGKTAEGARPGDAAAKETGAGPKTPAEVAPVQQSTSPPASSEQASAPPTERRQIGTYTVVAPRSGPTLLVQRQNDQAPWQRLTPGSRVFSTDPLVSLPGYLSDVRLDSGVYLQLRGMIPEFATDPGMRSLLESAVVLHPSKDVDLDFTLQRGRLYLSNHKEQGPARVRLRFGREIWNLTLTEPDTEVIVELMQNYVGDIRWQEGEEPLTSVYLAFLKGKGSLSADYQTYSDLQMGDKTFFIWDNKGRGLAGPAKLLKPFPQWDKSPPVTKDAEEMGNALEDLSKRMTDRKSVDVVLTEDLQSQRLSQRVLAIYALGALDEVRRLIDILGEEDPTRGWDRIKAVWVLQRWLSRGPQMATLLYDTKTRSGILTENRKYLSGEAETILKLLYGFSSAELRSADTYRVLADYLLSPKIAIRELAIGHLLRMGAQVKFNPAWPESERQKAATEVNKQVDEHKLPPPLPGPGGQGGGATPPAGR